MDYNDAVLRGVEYGWSSGTLARAEFFVEINECEIVKARYYPEVTGKRDNEISKKEHVNISEDDWKAVCDAVELLYPILREYAVFDTGINTPIANVVEQVLDGGDTFDFALTWEIDGGLVRKTYHQPDYERFCVLDAVLTELVNPIGREIPIYTAPILSGVHVVIGNEEGKNRYSFQCTENKAVPGEHYFFCYYPENGKNVRYPNSRADEATWQIIHNKVTELGIEKQAAGYATGGDVITLYYTNGKQREISLGKENGESLKATFLEIIGVEPVKKSRSLWEKIFRKH